MKRNLFVRFFAFMSAIILVAATAHAQSTATVQGTVLDTQKAAVPGATVVVRNTATGAERTLVTSFGVITNTRFPTGDSGSARQVQFAAKVLF